LDKITQKEIHKSSFFPPTKKIEYSTFDQKINICKTFSDLFFRKIKILKEFKENKVKL
jgi:hypothetical protein